ncbi:hypothetical protein [Cedecea davisae]|uniref:hypothetical protein n=1 Tax=Cedecea davisae TaxID=158484 RepID=UPI002431C075|nr:hypothetical protein [Cedecea davisae]
MMTAKILLSVVLWVIYFFVINISWAEILTVQRGYQIAGMLGISGDENVYNFIADLSLLISIIGSCILTFVSIILLIQRKKH